MKASNLQTNKPKSKWVKAAIQTDTDYLLSTEANRKHLKESIGQLNKRKGKAINTNDLWNS